MKKRTEGRRRTGRDSARQADPVAMTGVGATLLEKVRLQLCTHPPDVRCLVAVSGGRDSVALLHLLLAAGFRRLVVCHLNHQLRGRSATADANFVSGLAARLELPCEIKALDVKALARERRLSIETAAREARYEFLAACAGKRRCPRIFLGQHADDQVETFLFNLFRGAGPAGLCGMRAAATRLVGKTELVLLRPLLAVWREELDAFVKEQGIEFREDASNNSLAHARNRMRHRIIPAINEMFGRDVRHAIWRTADILGAEEEWLETIVSPVEPGALGVPELRSQPVALQRRLLSGWLRRAGIPNVGHGEIEAVRGLLEMQTARVNLPGNHHVRRREKRLFIEKEP